MGRDVTTGTYTPEDRRQYRRKIQRCLDALAAMLNSETFAFHRRQMGLEIELNLVDDRLRPAMTNTVVLEKIDDPMFTTELGQHNIELNVQPRPLAGNEAVQLEQDLRAILTRANTKAHDAGADMVMIGILPTVREEHFDPRWLSPNDRYALLNEQIFAARGEEMLLNMEGQPMPGRSADR
ncbi:glutamate--cysteine ligase, partial [Kibdelosporangium lantanae]